VKRSGGKGKREAWKKNREGGDIRKY